MSLRSHLQRFTRGQTTPQRSQPRLEALEERCLLSAPDQFLSRGLSGGGALYAPAISPHDPNEVYMPTDMNQMFHSKNFGASWDYYNYQELRWNNRLNGVQFTDDPNILYAIHANSTRSTIPVQSSDAGLTWARAGTSGFPSDWPASEWAQRIYVDVHDHARILIKSLDKLWYSGNAGLNFTVKFTSQPGRALHTAGAFFDGPNIFVASSDGLLASTDNGSTFARATFQGAPLQGIPASEGIYSFTGAKQGNVTRFFAVTVQSSAAGSLNAPYNQAASVYTMDWQQSNWVSISSGFGSLDRAGHVAMAPDNVAIAYVAGRSGSTGNMKPFLAKTADGGLSWQYVFNVNPNNANIYTGWMGVQGDRPIGSNVWGLTVCATDPNRVIVTDGYVAHGSVDGGQLWHQLYVTPGEEHPAGQPTPRGQAYHSNGLNNTTAWWLTWSDANNLFVANDDIVGQRSTDGGQTWSFNYTGLSGEVYQLRQHPTTGTLYAATGKGLPIYTILGLIEDPNYPTSGNIKFSTDQGATWQMLWDFGHQVVWTALDPNDPRTMYASVSDSQAGGIYVSHNIDLGSAATFTRLAQQPPRTEGHPLTIEVLNDGSLLATFSGRRPRNTNTFTDSSGVFLGTPNADGTVTWQDRSDPAMHYWTKDLVLDPHDPTQSTWFVAVRMVPHPVASSSFPSNRPGVYMTTNRGLTWTRIFTADAESVAIHPTNANEMYVATGDNGLWYTSNLRSVTSTGTPNPTITHVTGYPHPWPWRVFFNPYNPSEVWVAGNGNGLMVGNTAAGPGSFQLAGSAVSAGEGAGLVAVTVTRSGDLSMAMTVDYLFASGTADSGADWTAPVLPGGRSGTLTFAPGQATATVLVQLLDDDVAEEAETILLSLLNPSSGNVLGAVNTAELTILDDDTPALFSDPLAAG